MGTRSLIKLIYRSSVWAKIFLCYDGYYTGVGKQLVDFLLKVKLTNCLPLATTIGEYNSNLLANGPDDLMLQIIVHFKLLSCTKNNANDIKVPIVPGGVYLCDPTWPDKDCGRPYYIYEVIFEDDEVQKDGWKIKLVVKNPMETIVFNDEPCKFDDFIKSQLGE